MREGLLDAYPESDIDVIIVWISMMDSDTAAAVQQISSIFADKRVHQFFDPTQSVGKAVAASLGAEGEVSWDTYLFYGPGTKWQALPPAPTDYMHQLFDFPWADQSKMRTGDDLVVGLREAMARLKDVTG